MGLRVTTGSPPALEAALAREVAAAQEDDPLTPIGVLLGGTLQRPYLQRRLAELNDGIVNVRFMMPSEFAMELGERAMIEAGKRPLPPLADRILLREIAVELDGYFEPVRETPGLADAFSRLVRELRGAGYDAESLSAAIDGSCELPEKAEAIRGVFSEFLLRRKSFYGPDDCLLAAEPERAPWRALFVFGLWQAPAAVIDTIARLAEEIPVTVLLPTTGIGEADSAHVDLRSALLERGAEVTALEEPSRPDTALQATRSSLFRIPEDPVEPDDSLKLISGPDPAREVREVTRQCIGWARDGIQFHEMAIAYRHPDPYRSLIESVFIEAGVPVYLHEGTPMSERPLGRRVIALLELIDTELDRRALIDFLSDGRLPGETWERYGKPSAGLWDRFSRRAGVVRGFEEWKRRLNAYRDDLADSDREWRRAEAERVETFLGFVRDLSRDLSAHPGSAAWSEHHAHLDRLLHTYVSDPEPILDALAGLDRFDALDEETTFERFRQTVITTIENLRTDEAEPGGREGAFGLRGVNVLDVNSLRHLRFRAVAIVGLAERAFPSPPSPDPILLDDERERLNEHGPAPIPLRVRGADPEPLQFALAAYAARERLLATYPRKGTADARPQLPSRFYRALAEAAVGRRVAAQEVDRLPDWLYARASGSKVGAARLDRAISLEEYDRTLIESDTDLGRAALTRVEPRFARAIEAKRARFSPKLGEFDGVLGEEARALLAEFFDPLDGVSPSLLEDYATCPHRVFVGNVLRAKVDEEPEQTIRLNPGDRGTLLHRILERFMFEPPRAGEKRLHGSHEEERLLGIAEEEFERCRERGQTGFPAMWAADRLELIEDLKAWLENERLDELATVLSEGAYEVRFGYGWGETDSDGGLSRDDPIEISADGLKLEVSGRIDRLNWDPDRTRFRVVDYKTGSTYDQPKDGLLGGGRSLQLPLYMLAAGRVLDIDPRRGEAEYHYSTRRGGFKRGRFTGEDFSGRRKDLAFILGEMLGGMRSGVYPMAITSKDECKFCVARQLCPADRMRIVERKAGAKARKGIDRIREVE
jgi:ATP-dependent helicase/nuclease subunit B